MSQNNTAIKQHVLYIECILCVTSYSIIRCTNIITPRGNQRLFVLAVPLRGFRINSSERERGDYQMTAVILLREFPANWLLMSFLQKQLDISHARHKNLGIKPQWFTATMCSRYISDKCHPFVSLTNNGTIYWTLCCIFVSVTRNTLRCSNDGRHSWDHGSTSISRMLTYVTNLVEVKWKCVLFQMPTPTCCLVFFCSSSCLCICRAPLMLFWRRYQSEILMMSSAFLAVYISKESKRLIGICVLPQKLVSKRDGVFIRGGALRRTCSQPGSFFCNYCTTVVFQLAVGYASWYHP